MRRPRVRGGDGVGRYGGRGCLLVASCRARGGGQQGWGWWWWYGGTEAAWGRRLVMVWSSRVSGGSQVRGAFFISI